MEIYDLKQNTWTLIHIKEFVVTAGQLLCIGSELYVVGGRDRNHYSQKLVWIYETNSKKWKKGKKCLKARTSPALCYVPLE